MFDELMLKRHQKILRKNKEVCEFLKNKIELPSEVMMFDRRMKFKCWVHSHISPIDFEARDDKEETAILFSCELRDTSRQLFSSSSTTLNDWHHSKVADSAKENVRGALSSLFADMTYRILKDIEEI